MYLTHFGLKHDPLGKNIREVVGSTQNLQLDEKLNWLLETKGVALISGDAGTGKTTAVRQWAKSLNSMTHKIIYQADNHFQPFDIYSQFADSLGVETCYRYSRLWRKLKEELQSMSENKNITPVWILDEAHLLPKKFLSELPSFLNFSFDTKNIIIIILVGLPSLKLTLNRSFYSALTSRMLFQFDWEAIEDMGLFSELIQKAFKLAGRSEKIMADSGIQLIHMASKGRLRYAHRLITQALYLAARNNLNNLPDEIINQSIEEIKS